MWSPSTPAPSPHCPVRCLLTVLSFRPSFMVIPHVLFFPLAALLLSLSVSPSLHVTHLSSPMLLSPWKAVSLCQCLAACFLPVLTSELIFQLRHPAVQGSADRGGSIGPRHLLQGECSALKQQRAPGTQVGRKDLRSMSFCPESRDRPKGIS